MNRTSAIGYKLFKVKKSCPGELFPLYVNADKSMPMNVWIEAECGEILPNGKVKAKLGNGNLLWLASDLIPCSSLSLCFYSQKSNFKRLSSQTGRILYCGTE